MSGNNRNNSNYYDEREAYRRHRDREDEARSNVIENYHRNKNNRAADPMEFRDVSRADEGNNAIHPNMNCHPGKR